MRGAHHCSGPPISEMTYTVSSGTLNSTTPYHTFLLEPKVSSGALACHIPGMTLSTNSHTNYVEHGPMACFQLVELMQGCRQVTTLALYSVGSYWDQQFYSVCVSVCCRVQFLLLCWLHQTFLVSCLYYSYSWQIVLNDSIPNCSYSQVLICHILLNLHVLHWLIVFGWTAV